MFIVAFTISHLYRDNKTYWMGLGESLDSYIELTGDLVLIFWCLMPLSAIFLAISWRPVLVVEAAGEPPAIVKQLVNFISCESSTPFL